jgi:hypothetical protein
MSHDQDIDKPIELSGDNDSEFTLLRDLTDREKTDTLDDYLEKFKDARGNMELLYPSMIENYKKYRSIADPLIDELGKKIEGRANLFVPYPWAIVEAELPRLAGRLPRVRAFPRKPSSKTKVASIQDLIYYTFDRMEFLKIQILWMRQHSIYGWSPLFYWWRKETRQILDRVIDDDGANRLIKVEKNVWDDFYCRVLDVFDCFFQPGVDEIEAGDWFMFRVWHSRKDLEAMVKGEILYPEVMEYLEDGGNLATSEIDGAGKAERDQLIGLQRSVRKNAYGKHELLYVLENERTVVILDRTILARVGDNPHPLQEKSIIPMKLTPMVSEPIGMGTIEALGGLPEKLNAITNARLDNISLLINKVVIANRYAQIDFQNLKFTAGNVILTDNIENSLKFLDAPDVSVSSEREIFATKEELQFVAGVSDFIVGNTGSARLPGTATGISTIVREANARFALKLSTFEASSLRRLVEAIHAYNRLFMPEEKTIHILGPKGYEMKSITLDEVNIDSEFTVEPGSSVPLDQLTRREALGAALPNLMNLSQIIDIEKFVKEYLESLDIRNADTFFFSSEELPEQNDIQLAQAENVALQQLQKIDLLGNSSLHITVHSQPIESGEWNSWQEDQKTALMDHIQQHLKQMQEQQAQAAQVSATTLFGGANASGEQVQNTAGPSSPATTPGENAGIPGPATLFGGV